ncbi:hypothetical protein [Flavobacterium sp. GCM10027622]|uniref:hypothetical protein n=1 Tax=unclassified Flavobacterium TaxID=196869 RepID=UPI00360E47EE
MKNLLITSLILFSLFSCSKKESEKLKAVNDLDKLCKFVDQSEIIKDSIKKLKSYNQKLIVCNYKETKENGIITLNIACLPYQIDNDYFYKNIKGTNVLFINRKKKISNRKPNDNLDKLITEKLVRFEENNTLCESAYLRFVYCKKDSINMKCFDNITANKEDWLGRKDWEKHSEKNLYPKCN